MTIPGREHRNWIRGIYLFLVHTSEQKHPYALVVSFCNYSMHLIVISSIKSFSALRAWRSRDTGFDTLRSSDCFLPRKVQICSAAHPVTLVMPTVDALFRDKAVGAWNQTLIFTYCRKHTSTSHRISRFRTVTTRLFLFTFLVVSYHSQLWAPFRQNNIVPPSECY